MRLETLKMICSNVKTVIYMVYKIIFALPVFLKNTVELILIFLFGLFAWFGFKLVCILICQIIKTLIYVFAYTLQALLALIYKVSAEQKREVIGRIDEKISDGGSRAIKAITAVQGLLLRTITKKYGNEEEIEKRKSIRNTVLVVIFGILLVLSCLPETALVKQMNPQYQPTFMVVRDLLQKIEKVVAPDIDNYPDVMIHRKKKDTEQKESEAKVYLTLNDKGKNGSYIRENPSIDAKALSVITQENQICYLNKSYFDGERYWLNVSVDEDQVCGWMSSRLVDEEQLRGLDIEKDQK